MKKLPTGDELVKLIGLSESDDRVLNLFDSLDIDKSDLERDEDIGSFWIDLDDSGGEGSSISFEPANNSDKKNNIGGQYLTNIELDYNFEPLPFGLTDENSLNLVEQKLGKKANYMSIDDPDRLFWFYEDLKWSFSVIFEEDSNYSSIMKLLLADHEGPLEVECYEGKEAFLKPFVS